MSDWSTDSNWYYLFMLAAALFAWMWRDMRKWKKDYLWMKGLFENSQGALHVAKSEVHELVMNPDGPEAMRIRILVRTSAQAEEGIWLGRYGPEEGNRHTGGLYSQMTRDETTEQ